MQDANPVRRSSAPSLDDSAAVRIAVYTMRAGGSCSSSMLRDRPGDGALADAGEPSLGRGDADGRARPAALVVSEISDRASFAALATEWNALVVASSDQLFYRHEFLRTWLEHFAATKAWRVLIARNQHGTLVGALPLLHERTRMYGLPMRQLVAAANPHSCRFDLIATEPAKVSEAFLEHLLRDDGWDLLRLTDVPEGGAARMLEQCARAQRLPVGIWHSLDSPYIPLPTTHQALLATLPAKFLANCRRRRKKLEQHGAVTLERVEGGPLLSARLAEAFALEQSGWKGERGTAIAQDPATRAFYAELARVAAARGWLALYFLRCAGRAVAFQFGLTYAARYLLLKPAYDESLKPCSPGQLLMHEVVRDCIARGLGEVDFLGPDMIWKRDWTDRTRVHEWIFVFRNTTLGRALHQAKFGWVFAARERLRRWNR